MNTFIHLVRHGHVANPAHIRYGQRTGYVLSPRGEAQAREAGAHLRGVVRPLEVAAIVSSPLERAVQTATLLQIELGVARIEIDDRLIEAPTRFDGAPRLAPALPWNWRHLRDPFTPSWGEPFVDVKSRMHAALIAHAGAHAREHVVVVSHQAPIWIARQSFRPRRRPPWLQRVRCAHASITSIELDGDRYVGETYWAPTTS